MKKRRFIVMVFGALIIATGVGLWGARPKRPPVFEFTGYDRVGTNEWQFARLKLRNMTGKPIWIVSSGPEFPLKPELLSQPTTVRPAATNSDWTNVISVSVGHHFMHAEKLLPGEDFEVKYPIAPAKEPERAGIIYYTGDFQDGNELIGHLFTPLLDDRATLKDRIKFYWDKYRRKTKAPGRYEVWCPQLLSFQADGQTNSGK